MVDGDIVADHRLRADYNAKPLMRQPEVLADLNLKRNVTGINDTADVLEELGNAPPFLNRLHALIDRYVNLAAPMCIPPD